MKATFIVTSAIVTNMGAFAEETRLLQTMETIRSIRRHYEDANVILVDGGRSMPADSKLWEHVRELVNVYMDISSNEQIQHLHNNIMSKVTNPHEMGGLSGLSKSLAEMTLMMEALLAIKNHAELQPIRESDRIFKISGRYQLSPMFDAGYYDQVKGRYVFKTRDKSWMPDALENVGTDHGFNSRLWSFDTELLDQTIEKFQDMIADMQEISQTHYIDIEHLLYKHIGTDNAVEVEHTHLFGPLGPNAMVVYD
jgi:hypothetical protein